MPVAIVPDITLSMEIRIDKMKKAKGHIKRRKQIVKALSVKSSQVKSSGDKYVLNIRTKTSLPFLNEILIYCN